MLTLLCLCCLLVLTLTEFAVNDQGSLMQSVVWLVCIATPPEYKRMNSPLINVLSGHNHLHISWFKISTHITTYHEKV